MLGSTLEVPDGIHTRGVFLLIIRTKVSSSVVETISWLGDLPQIFFEVIPASFKIKWFPPKRNKYQLYASFLEVSRYGRLKSDFIPTVFLIVYTVDTVSAQHFAQNTFRQFFVQAVYNNNLWSETIVGILLWSESFEQNLTAMQRKLKRCFFYLSYYLGLIISSSLRLYFWGSSYFRHSSSHYDKSYDEGKQSMHLKVEELRLNIYQIIDL